MFATSRISTDAPVWFIRRGSASARIASQAADPQLSYSAAA
ncbi:MAG: hypothetical protein QHC89_19525 [Bosea sp. (in: a-proteobacteria)]|nr:hypothetical protein [Bosea sp. (in: a-proteobacteria)]